MSFTRAKRKLIIVGSRSTLETDRLLSDFFSLVEEKNWIYKIPSHAIELYEGIFPYAVPKTPKKEGKSKERNAIAKAILAGRPFAREALGVSRAPFLTTR